MLGREHEAVVQKLYTLFELAKVHVAKAQIAEEVGIIMPGGELLHKVDSEPRLSPEAASASPCKPMQRPASCGPTGCLPGFGGAS